MSGGREGIVLFAHGSRDPRWAAPFQKIAESLARTLPHTAVMVSYLEQMAPSLHEAVAHLAANGVGKIRIVPVFFAQGGHMKEDLPKLVAAVRSAHRAVEIDLEPPIGERPEVIAAIAQVIAATRSARPSP